MGISKTLKVRILGLGDEGIRALPSVARAVRELWPRDRVLAIESIPSGDDARLAARTIRLWCDRDRVEVIFTVGRGGHAREDFAPEVTTALLERSLPGIEERMYLVSARRPCDLLFRGRAGMRRGTLVVNLPTRPSRARSIVRFLGPVIGHALEKARGSNRECGEAGGQR